MKIPEKSYLVTGILLAIFPLSAHANAGVPMLFVIMPGLAYSLIPIILVEALYLWKKLSVEPMVAGQLSVIANLVSTIAGIPVTWFLLVCIQMVTGGGAAYGLDTWLGKVIAVTWQAPWLIPYEGDLDWMVPVAALVLLLPFFLVSWWSEYLVSKAMTKDGELPQLKHAIRNANLISYGLLSLLPIGMLVLKD